MVTAGIFMVARMAPLFELRSCAAFVTVIGATTALFMGVLGIVQNDIKRVVAYSTLSQLGYMTVALGVSAYSAGIFLMTHAFFKAACCSSPRARLSSGTLTSRICAIWAARGSRCRHLDYGGDRVAGADRRSARSRAY